MARGTVFVGSLAKVSALMFGLAVPAAGWADPARCDAVFIGPIEGCSLSGEWSTAATARSEAKARKLAIERLGLAVQAGADVQAERVAGTMAMLTAETDQRSCKVAALEMAHISCVEESTLAEDQICIADLPDDTCYDGLPIDHVGVAWKVAEQGRAELCAAVDDRLAEQGASAADRRTCQVSCARNARVRCVPR
jgi:hypothetical protein